MKFGVLMVLAALAASAALRAEAPPERRLPVAVLGDSDSHSYHDALNGIGRGGAGNPKTFNWLEAWARLRPDEIDPGPVVAAGDPRLLARAKSLFGVPTRTPRKLDYLYNYAWSGARCDSLMEAWPEQGARLLTRLGSEPARWRDGLIVIRIGVNDFGQAEHLRAWSAAPAAAVPVVDKCLAAIGRTVAAIRKRSSVRIALVGVAHDYNAPFAGEEAAPTHAIAQVEGVLARFDAGLQALATRDPRIAYIDDVSWFEARYGSRRFASLAPATTVADLVVQNQTGDDPQSLHTADGHPGTVASGLFLQHLVRGLNVRFGWDLSVPSDEEIAALAR